MDRRNPPRIVFDRVVSANADIKKYWLLHRIEEPDISGNRVTITRAKNEDKGELSTRHYFRVLTTQKSKRLEEKERNSGSSGQTIKTIGQSDVPTSQMSEAVREFSLYAGNLRRRITS
jgi:hypothetical protein